nr:PREDICTED: protein kintoun isoform X1 [Lepisosteus oculatus]
MESGSKLEELNLTSDEIDRFSKAFKDEKFREMLKEYAEEISNPENRKKYEEEITMMEQERGMDIQFIHPKPCRVLKTSVRGEQKCFINICSNELIAKPECKPGKGSDDKLGQHWSLPYSLAPGRQDLDSKGNRHMIYDVVFHPDTLYIAGKNERFMKLVDRTAMEGIQKQFNVKLDERNVKVLKMKYKGVPHPAVIRKPLHGHPVKETEPVNPNDPLQFPYPYDKKGNTAQEDNTVIREEKLDYIKPAPNQSNEPTEPRYTIKYRSYIDLQDYTCSRDTAPGPRPKEIVITVDLPLLKSAADAELNVTEKQFLLESKKPAYRLVVTLPYPIDENQGEAKFVKLKKQLVVTLTVLPLKRPTTAQMNTHLVGETLCGKDRFEDLEPGSAEKAENETLADDLVKQQETNVMQSPATPVSPKSQPKELDPSEGVDIIPEPIATDTQKGSGGSIYCLQSSKSCCPNDASQSTDHTCDDQLATETNPSNDELFREERDADMSHQSRDEDNNIPEETANAACVILSSVDSSVRDEPSSPEAVIQEMEKETNTHAAVKRKQITTCHTACEPVCRFALNKGNSTEQTRPASVKQATMKHSETVGSDLNPSAPCSDSKEVPFTALKTAGTPVATGIGQRASRTAHFKEESGERDGNELDEDDLLTEQKNEFMDSEPAPAIIREINPTDGTVEVLNNHTTSARFSFLNSLLYELD